MTPKPITRKIFYVALGVLFLALCRPAEGQQATGKIFRIGFLAESTPSSMAGLLEVFRQELRKLGWTEGKNITI